MLVKNIGPIIRESDQNSSTTLPFVFQGDTTDLVTYEL